MKSSPRVLVSLRCSATLAALAALATPALANGRSPATIDVRTRSGSTQLVAATTFGLTVSSNEGGSWQWVCEDAVGYGGTFDPDYEWSPTSGKLFATSLGGLRTTADSCTFDLDTGLAGRYIAAIAFGADGALYAAANDSTSLIYRSTDDGETFPRVSQADPPFKRYDSWLSLEVAPSDPTRVYLAGIRVAAARPTEFLLYRSIDAATNFRILPLPTFTPTMNSNIELAGVSPTDADVVYVRVTAVAGGGDAIFRSADGGSSWSALPVLAKADSLRAFVVRRDGTVYAGTPTLGSFQSTDGISFTPVAGAPRLNCVTERADGVLFGCTQNYGSPNDGAGVMQSTDGVAWTSSMRYQEIAAPQACAAGTTQKDSCEVEVWCGIKEQLGITSTAINCPLIVPDGMQDAGQPPSSSGGCCQTNQTPPSLLLCGLTALLLAWRKRRPRSSRR